MARTVAIGGWSLVERLAIVLVLAVTASCGGGSNSGGMAAPSGLTYPSPQSYTAGTAIAALTPSVTGTVASYSVSPGLPPGLALDIASGRISGTPTAATATASYTITATNAAGSTTFKLSVTVNPAAPSALSYPSPQTFYVGSAITPLLPSVTGTASSYSVVPALPAGLAFDATSGQVTGTPTTITEPTSYTITAANVTGSTSFDLSIAVVLLPPSGLSYGGPQSYAAGFAIKPLAPAVSGGPVAGYSVTPALPSGLGLDAMTGQITGTPTTPTAAADYTVTAQNAAGSASVKLSIAIVTVTVAPATLSRIVAGGTSVALTVTVAPVGFTFAGSLSAKAVDATGLFLANVQVAPAGSGATLTLMTTAMAIPTGRYTSGVTISLCSDPACAVPQPVPSITVPFDVWVLAGLWPGDNLTTLGAWSGVAEWSMFQGSAAHTGYVPVTLDVNQFSTRWRAPASLIGGTNSANISGVATTGGVLYVAGGYVLNARNEFDGSVVWQHDFSGLQYPSVNPPAVANGAVYIAAGQQNSTALYAFSAADGSQVFSSPMTSQWEHYLAPTIGALGIYTNGGYGGGLYAFDPSGQQLFFDYLAQTSVWTPAVDATGVYSYTGGVLQVADPKSGAVLTSITDPTFANYSYQIGGSPVLGPTGTVFVANYANAALAGPSGNRLISFNVPGSAIAWQIPGNFASTPAYAKGILFVANDNPLQLEARSGTDGSLLWSWTPTAVVDDSFTSEVLVTDNLAFVSTYYATYAIDLATHRCVWSYPTYPTGARLAMSPNGILYLNGPNYLTAINVK